MTLPVDCDDPQVLLMLALERGPGHLDEVSHAVLERYTLSMIVMQVVLEDGEGHGRYRVKVGYYTDNTLACGMRDAFGRHLKNIRAAAAEVMKGL
jgi:hypothetical protein